MTDRDTPVQVARAVREDGPLDVWNSVRQATCARGMAVDTVPADNRRRWSRIAMILANLIALTEHRRRLLILTALSFLTLC
ncbi:MAG: hypothetical protein KF817_12530 [Phycisphaeraceae bacterium]|nr:hypothetical protein [Phycisphaeraceae bacterium]